MREHSRILVALSLAFVTALIGCPGSLEDPARFTGCLDVQKIFARDCLGSGCHNTKDNSGNLDLESPDIGKRLAGVKSSTQLSYLIDTTTPEKSTLYTKLNAPTFGNRMPLNKPAQDIKTQDCVLAWLKTYRAPPDAAADARPSDASHDASDSGGGRDLTTDTTKFGLGGPTLCATANVQLCEGFETGSLDPNTWKVIGTPPTIDSVQTARGLKALHIKQSGDGPSYIEETRTFPAKNNTYFGRAFVWFATLAGPPMNYAHWTFIGAVGTNVSGEIRVSGQFQNGKNLFGVGTDNRVDDAGTGDWTTSDTDFNGNPTAVPTNQWLCIEWLHKGDTNETRLYWNAVEHPSLHTTATTNGGNGNPYILPDFTSVWLGWQEYQPSTLQFDMWLDEIAIDPSRIGCAL